MTTQQINTCACADRADKAITGDVVISQDAAGAGGNLTVENTLNVGTLNAGNIAVSTGQAAVELATFTGDGIKTAFAVNHTQTTTLVTAALYNASWNQVGADMRVVDDTTVEFTFGTAPPAGTQFNAVIVQYLAPQISVGE